MTMSSKTSWPFLDQKLSFLEHTDVIMKKAVTG